MKLVPVTPETLTKEQEQPLRMAGHSYALEERGMQGRSDDELKKGLEAQAALINAEREVGVRAVVEVLREIMAGLDESDWHWTEYPKRLSKAVSAADELLALYPEQP